MIKSRLTGNGLKNRNQYNKHDNMYSICFFICDTKFHSLKKRDYSEGYALCESIIFIFLFITMQINYKFLPLQTLCNLDSWGRQGHRSINWVDPKYNLLITPFKYICFLKDEKTLRDFQDFSFVKSSFVRSKNFKQSFSLQNFICLNFFLNKKR